MNLTEREKEIVKGYIDRGEVVGASPALLAVFEQIDVANRLDELAPVLILGEPGVGKTHIASLVHTAGNRRAGPFRAVNAGGTGGDVTIQRGEWIGFSLGHGIAGVERKGKPGYLQDADGGTLFVDECASLSPQLQAIFLSVLEGRAVETVGGRPVVPSVRCVFATNADIEREVASGRMRRDLLDRIGLRIHIPPLRERKGDVLLLTRHFAPDVRFEERCLVALLRHDWPGNIRELENTLNLARARAETEESSHVLLEHLSIPVASSEAVRCLKGDECRRELWLAADALAKAEGYEAGDGLQRRAGEILGTQQAQASKMYTKFGLNEVRGRVLALS